MKYASLIIVFFFGMTACQLSSFEDLNSITLASDSIRSQYAPDKRVAIYDISISFDKGIFEIGGETDQPEALLALEQKVEEAGYSVNNKVVLLPDSTVGSTVYGVVKNSVANIRSQSRHSGELATQALLGMEVKVLQIKGEWYRVQTPDQYISWVDHGGVELMTKNQIEEWRSSNKVIVTAKMSHVYQDNTQQVILADVVMGNRLINIGEVEGAFRVKYPDGREGYLTKTDGSALAGWQEQLSANADLVEAHAMNLLGTPYLWGGTSVKGVDCSGFTKTVYMMNGIQLARDASQQVNGGKPVAEGENFESLQKGDLMFFGRSATDSTKRKVTHVGIWLGDGEFIHSSQRVRVGSIDPESPKYDGFNKNRFLEARRYLP